MANDNPENWTPEQIRNKAAEKWQFRFYSGGIIVGLLSWACFANHAEEAGKIFALFAIAAFGLGSLIKTSWVKSGQRDYYVINKEWEATRMKVYSWSVVAVLLGVLALTNGAQQFGGFVAVLGGVGLLIGAQLPVKWIKVAEIAPYKPSGGETPLGVLLIVGLLVIANLGGTPPESTAPKPPGKTSIPPDPSQSPPFIGPQPYALDSGRRWVVIGTRPTLDAARNFAGRYASSFPHITIFLTQNGQYAISNGTISYPSEVEIKNQWISQGRIPGDSFLSYGRSFLREYPR